MGRTAIYARYSTEKQHEASLDDQVHNCKERAKRDHLTVDQDDIYTDAATSGSLRDRPGLEALNAKIQTGCYDTVIVDDLSRLSRNQIHTLITTFRFQNMGVRVIAIADGIDTNDKSSKTMIQFKALFNEIYLDDIKQKTKRGQEGLVRQGLVFSQCYGYRIIKSPDKKRASGEAYSDAVIHLEEADIVTKIFKDFASCKSIHQIARDLNENKVPSKKGKRGGWNISTISRILKNERYIGISYWGRSRNITDPLTGKRRQVQRSRHEWLETKREDLRIIPKDLWDKVQKRLKEVQDTSPRKMSTNSKRQSYVKTNPPHLLAGTLRCSECGSSIVQVSGKESGYYGCYRSRQSKCTNKVLVPRRRLEDKFLNSLMDSILTPDNITYLFRRVEKELKKVVRIAPELMKKKRKVSEKLERDLNNMIDFVKMGHLSQSIAEEIKLVEKELETVKQDIEKYENSKAKQFTTPPKEWIIDRLLHVRELLGKRTEQSALLIRKMTNELTMTPVYPPESEGKPYYHVDCDVLSTAILKRTDKGSNWLQWWKRRESNPGPSLFSNDIYMLSLLFKSHLISTQ